MPGIDNSKKLTEWQRCLLNEQLQPLRRGWRKPPVLLGTWITRGSKDLFDIQLLGRPALTFYQQELKPYYESQSWGRKFVLWWKRLDSGFRQKERLWAYARNYLAYQTELKNLSSIDSSVRAERFKLQRVVLSKEENMWRTSFVPEKKPSNLPMTEKTLVKIQQEASKKVAQWLSPLFKEHKKILDVITANPSATLQDYKKEEKRLARIRHEKYLEERDKWTAQWKQTNQKFQFEGDCFFAFRNQEEMFKKTLVRPSLKIEEKISAVPSKKTAQTLRRNFYGRLGIAFPNPSSPTKNALVVVPPSASQTMPLEKPLFQHHNAQITFETITQNTLHQLSVQELTDEQIIEILKEYKQAIEMRLSILVDQGKTLIELAIDQGTLYDESMHKAITELEKQIREIYKKMVFVLHSDKHLAWQTKQAIKNKANELFGEARDLVLTKTTKLQDFVDNPRKLLVESPRLVQHLKNIEKGEEKKLYQTCMIILKELEETIKKDSEENRRNHESWLQREEESAQKFLEEYTTQIDKYLGKQEKLFQEERETHQREKETYKKDTEMQIQLLREELIQMFQKKVNEQEICTQEDLMAIFEEMQTRLILSEQLQGDDLPGNQGSLTLKEEDKANFYNTDSYKQHGFCYSPAQQAIIQPEKSQVKLRFSIF